MTVSEQAQVKVQCPECGYSDFPHGDQFCRNCGKRLPALPRDVFDMDVTVNVKEAQGDVTGVKIGTLIGDLIMGPDEEVRARNRRNLRVLLSKVQNFWINGVLAASLKGAKMIELNKHLVADAITQPWEGVINIPESGSVDSQAPIEQVFDQEEVALLIMDGAGSGKTTTLLAMAGQALSQAASDPEKSIPVVLNLITWPQHHGTIADWVVRELALRYQISESSAKQWLEEQRLALFLDGLDEVGPEHIRTCIQVINEFRQKYGSLQISVCVRSADYKAAGETLALKTALALEPMNEAQIQDYIQSTGNNADTLQSLLSQDKEMLSLARSPLIMSLLKDAYQDVPVSALQEEQLDTPEERRAYLFSTYIQRIFSRGTKEGAQPFSRQLTMEYLGWIARKLEQVGQNIVQPDLLQPAWLSSFAQRWLYWPASRSLIGLFIGLLLGLTAEIASSPAGRLSYILASVLAGLLTGLFDGLIAALAGKRAPLSARAGLWLRIAHGLMAALFAFGCYWVVFNFGLHLGLETRRLAAGAAAIFGVLFSADWRLNSNLDDIRPTAALKFSPKDSLRGVLPGVVLSLGMIGAIGLIFAPFAPVQVWFPFGIAYGSIGLSAVMLAYSWRELDPDSFPGQGIHLALTNAGLGGLWTGLISGLFYSLIYGAGPGAIVGLRLAGLGAVWYGGYFLIKVIILRFLLIISGKIPTRFVDFLNYAAHLGLLQRVGGGFRFPNRLIQEYLSQIPLSELQAKNLS